MRNAEFGKGKERRILVELQGRCRLTDDGCRKSDCMDSSFLNPFDPPAPSIERCLTLCLMLFASVPATLLILDLPLSDVLLYALCPLLYALFAHNTQPATRNPHPPTRNPQLTTPNSQLTTRIQLKLFRRKGNHVINFSCVAKQHHQTIDSQCIAAGIRHVF
jgi:hypothetical protein